MKDPNQKSLAEILSEDLSPTQAEHLKQALSSLQSDTNHNVALNRVRARALDIPHEITQSSIWNFGFSKSIAASVFVVIVSVGIFETRSMQSIPVVTSTHTAMNTHITVAADNDEEDFSDTDIEDLTASLNLDDDLPDEDDLEIL